MNSLHPVFEEVFQSHFRALEIAGQMRLPGGDFHQICKREDDPATQDTSVPYSMPAGPYDRL
ncbi:MAG: hypothetical protein KGL39_20460 [Patescibacteria group bacterium]|nr:hypothetical protein [Patescibacteria group bacterium]